jgi:DNA-binding CsgD family transcriptional regulator
MFDTIKPYQSLAVLLVFKIQLKETVLILIFFTLVIASGIDLFSDFSENLDFTHVIKEAVILVISLLAVAWLLFDMRQQAIEIRTLRKELSIIKKPAQVPKKEVLEAKKTLSHVISVQFDDWNLSNSEKEVGWLLLKGLSLKEIAMLRNTLEKTVRQQASAIYKKAGINGRHAFSAWFIEDVL